MGMLMFSQYLIAENPFRGGRNRYQHPRFFQTSYYSRIIAISSPLSNRVVDEPTTGILFHPAPHKPTNVCLLYTSDAADE